MNFDRYRRPIAMSDPGRHAALFDGLPRDTGALAETVQGLLIHQHIAPAYGVTLSRDQQAQSHVRAVEKILGDIVTRDGRPLSAARATDERQVGVCRHFTLLHVAMLRTQGIPARARCGFGAYFRLLLQQRPHPRLEARAHQGTQGQSAPCADRSRRRRRPDAPD